MLLVALKVPLLAFVTATSDASKPVTGSENVNVNVIAAKLVGPIAGLDVIATVG